MCRATAATAAFGQVDLFCSNAGIIVRGDEDAANADWQRDWGADVMAYAHAARAALPQIPARGEGCFDHTAFR